MDTPTTEDLITGLANMARNPNHMYSTRTMGQHAADRLRQLDAEVHERPGKEVLEALRRDLGRYYYDPQMSGLFPTCPPGLWDWVLGKESHGAVSVERDTDAPKAAVRNKVGDVLYGSDDHLEFIPDQPDPLGWSLDRWARWVTELTDDELAALTRGHLSAYPREVAKMLRAEPERRRVAAAGVQTFSTPEDKTAWEYMHWLETHRPSDLHAWAMLHGRTKTDPEPLTDTRDVWPDGSTSEREHPEASSKLFWASLDCPEPQPWQLFNPAVVNLHVETTYVDPDLSEALFGEQSVTTDEHGCLVIEYPRVLVVSGMIIVESHENRSDYIEAVTVMAVTREPAEWPAVGTTVTVETESQEDDPHLRKFTMPDHCVDKFLTELNEAIIWGAA